MENKKISISPGNIKMGAIPSVSLPAVVTCPKGIPCAKLCYALKISNLRKNVKNAYFRNLDILESNPASYWAQVKAAAIATRFFRYHVSGDIPNPEYLNNMIQLAQDLPHTEFLCFTKQHAFVNAFIAAGGSIPGNLKIILSQWDSSWKVDNPHGLPESAVIFKGEQPKEGWTVCPGNCFDCAIRGGGCWTLKSGETIAFNQH